MVRKLLLPLACILYVAPLCAEPIPLDPPTTNESIGIERFMIYVPREQWPHELERINITREVYVIEDTAQDQQYLLFRFADGQRVVTPRLRKADESTK